MTDREQTIAGLVGAWQEARDQGDWQDPEEIARAHPELADELRARFQALEVVEQAFAGRRILAGEAPRRIGEFEIVKVVGRGGMGVVYEAIQTSMGRRVALKVLYPSVTGSPRAVKRFVREARTTGRLQHTNIVPVYALGSEGGTWYYAMELVEGRSLAEILEAMRAKGAEVGTRPERCTLPPEETGDTSLHLLTGPAFDPEGAEAGTRPESCTLSSETAMATAQGAATFAGAGGTATYRQAAALFAEVADALQEAHDAGLIHRDVKPGNLMLDAKGHLKLLDFGLARMTGGQDAMTMTGEVLGTPVYMSPEQARAKTTEIDHRTDVYSLGATLYEVLTLAPPFAGEDFQTVYRQVLTHDPDQPRTHNGGIPRDLETIVLRAMEKEPAQRYASAAQMAKDLRAFADGHAIHTRRVGPVEKAWRKVKRHKVRTALVTATIVLAAAAAIFAVGQGRETARREAMEYERLVEQAQRLSGIVRPEHRGRSSSARGVETDLGLLERARSLQPDRPEAFFHGALIWERSLPDRLDDLDAAAERGFPERTVRLARALILWSEGRIDGARAEIERTRALPTHGVLDDAIEGMLLATQGRWQEALALYDHAVAASPPGTAVRRSALQWRAHARKRLGDREGALMDYAALLQAGSESIVVRVRIARLWAELGREEEARRAFDAVRDEVRARGTVEAWTALCEETRGGWRLAVTDEAVRANPEAAGLWAERSRALCSAYRYREATEAANRAVALAPDDVEALETQATGHHVQGKTWKAYVVLRQAQDLAPHDDGVRYTLSTVLRALGRPRRALVLCEAALEEDPYNPGWHAEKARALADGRRHEEALATVRRARALAPAHASFVLQEANLLRAMGREEEAYARIQEAREFEAPTRDDMASIAVALGNLERLDESLEVLDEALTRYGADPNLLYPRAWLLERRGDRDAAIRDARAALALVPGHRQARDVLWLATRNRDGDDPALALLDGWIAEDPTDLWPRRQKAIHLSNLGRLDEAIHVLEAALDVAPTNVPVLDLLQYLYAQTSRFDDAYAASREAVAADPDHPGLLVTLGGHANNRGAYDEARRHLERALALDPESSSAWAWLAVSLEGLGRRDDADRAARRAVEVDPTNATALEKLAQHEQSRGRYAEALALYDRALETGENGPMLRVNRATALAGLGRLPEALEEAAKIVEHRPQLVWARERYAQILRWAGRTEEALEQYRRGLRRLPPDHPGVERMLARIAKTLREAGRYAEAIEVLEEAISARPTYDAITQMAVCFAHLGDRGRERDLLGKAIDLAPTTYGLAHERLAMSLSFDGRMAEGLEIAQRFADRFPDVAAAQATLAEQLSLRGEHERVLAPANRALELDPHEPRAHTWRLWAYHQLGQSDAVLQTAPAAKAALERAVRLWPFEVMYPGNLAMAGIVHGEALAARGRESQAEASWREAAAVARRALERWPDDVQLQQKLSQAEQALASAGGAD